jgi:23S rRNA pseudouridine955/2504/2580 synthase
VVSKQGKPAMTRFRLLESFSGYSYAEAELFTGRTHQIRAHAEHIGLPLAGDKKYSERKSLRLWRKRGLKRIFLHAHHLGVSSPANESLEFNAPLPGVLRDVLDHLER